jgi:hypothetical protein
MTDRGPEASPVWASETASRLPERHSLEVEAARFAVRAARLGEEALRFAEEELVPVSPPRRWGDMRAEHSRSPGSARPDNPLPMSLLRHGLSRPFLLSRPARPIGGCFIVGLLIFHCHSRVIHPGWCPSGPRISTNVSTRVRHDEDLDHEPAMAEPRIPGVRGLGTTTYNGPRISMIIDGTSPWSWSSPAGCDRRSCPR